MNNANKSTQMDDNELGARIVSHSRDARFSGTSQEEWRVRLQSLISAQAEVIGDVSVANVRQVGEAAGGSNGTLLFDASYASKDGAINGKFVLRFLPTEGLFHEYKLETQFGLQKALESTSVPVPAQRWLDAEGAYLVRPGYVMEQVEGVSPPMVWKVAGLIAEASVEDRRLMTTELIRAVADIHKVNWREAGLEWLENRATGENPIEREVNWYWDALTWSGNSEYIESLGPVREWLISNEPQDMDLVLCHGDCNFGNYMFSNNKVTAVIDWEMSFLGAPECDLTFLVAGHDVLGADLPWPEGALSFDDMFAEYERASGRKLRNMDYFFLFSAYRIAVINVLAMKHFPAEALESIMPILKRGPELCIARAKKLAGI